MLRKDNIQLDTVIDAIAKVKPRIQERFRVKEMAIFGSFARGEENADSDIDLLTDFDSDADLFDLTGLADFLENLLSRRVDVVSGKGLRKELRKTVLEEAIQI